MCRLPLAMNAMLLGSVLTSDTQRTNNACARHFVYLKLPLKDQPSEQITRYFDDSTSWIEEALRSNVVSEVIPRHQAAPGGGQAAPGGGHVVSEVIPRHQLNSNQTKSKRNERGFASLAT